MYTDGSSSGAPGHSSGGGIFCNCRGFVKGCFSSSFEAELLAVIKAINYAHIVGLMSLWIECDSIFMVNLLQTRSALVPWKHLASWRRCLHYLSSMNIQVTHVYREGNQVTDCLASHDHSLTQDGGLLA
ncbi:hypothetical protein ACOSQ3_030478 [Xanthoceras sorbifolium]